jgi:hypothetical protein
MVAPDEPAGGPDDALRKLVDQQTRVIKGLSVKVNELERRLQTLEARTP